MKEPLPPLQLSFSESTFLLWCTTSRSTPCNHASTILCTALQPMKSTTCTVRIKASKTSGVLKCGRNVSAQHAANNKADQGMCRSTKKHSCSVFAARPGSQSGFPPPKQCFTVTAPCKSSKRLTSPHTEHGSASSADLESPSSLSDPLGALVLQPTSSNRGSLSSKVCCIVTSVLSRDAMHSREAHIESYR